MYQERRTCCRNQQRCRRYHHIGPCGHHYITDCDVGVAAGSACGAERNSSRHRGNEGQWRQRSVMIRYRINGGPEQTEANVALPWERQYPVYNELESKVSADGGDTALTCTIIMDGDKVVAFKSEPRPACSFSYWG